MFRQLKGNNSGVVFVTVLMVIIVMAILTVSMISLNVSHTVIAENEAKRVKAETLAAGGLSYFLSNQLGPNPSNSITYNYCDTLEGVRYRVSITRTASGVGNPPPFNLNVSVNYPIGPYPIDFSTGCNIKS